MKLTVHKLYLILCEPHETHFLKHPVFIDYKIGRNRYEVYKGIV